jgi:AcrR family transcriptional regulator
MDDIAKRAGLSKGALYLYFDSKDALFAGLVETVALPNVERLEAMAHSAPSASDAIRAVMNFAPIVIRETPVPYMMKILIGDGARFPAVARAYRRQVIERGLSLIQSILERGIQSGEFRATDSALTARLVIAPVILSAVWQILFGTDPEAEVDLKALFGLHEAMLLRALAPTLEELSQ